MTLHFSSSIAAARKTGDQRGMGRLGRRPVSRPCASLGAALCAAAALVAASAQVQAQTPRGDVPTYAPPEPTAPTKVTSTSRLAVMVRRGDQGGLRFIENSALLAEVSGLKADASSFLSVRAGPGVAYREIDRLKTGRKLIPLSPDFEWMGIVYAEAVHTTAEAISLACQLDENHAANAPESAPYAGPCKSGWVNRKWVKMLVD